MSVYTRGYRSPKIKEEEVYYNDEEYGDRLQLSIKSDKTDFKDNLRVAKELLDSFPQKKIKIRPHIVSSDGIKNPELIIDELIADNKKIKGEKGVTSGFVKATTQGCKAVIIDLDANVKRLKINDLCKYISRRTPDLPGIIDECYVIFEGRVILITSRDKYHIKQELNKLKKASK